MTRRDGVAVVLTVLVIASAIVIAASAFRWLVVGALDEFGTSSTWSQAFSGALLVLVGSCAFAWTLGKWAS